MKKIKRAHVLLIIFVLVAIDFKASGRLDTFFAYRQCQQGEKLQQLGKYDLAEQKYTEALKIAPKDKEIKISLIHFYAGLSEKYASEKNYEKALFYLEKLLGIIPNNLGDNYNAGCYCISLKKYAKASEYFNKVLSIDPSYVKARQNLEYANYLANNEHLNSEIDSLSVTERAPSQLYSLIKTNLSSEVRAEAERVFDLIWQVPNGKTMLASIWTAQVSVNIIDIEGNGEFFYKKQGSKYVPEINIPLSYIQNIANKSLPADSRIHSMNVFVHEFGHAFASTNNLRKQDSLEEELGVSMIAYDIAYKIITGNYLNDRQIQYYSWGVLRSLLSDSHRDLPVYNGFNQKMANCGIRMPAIYLYSDIPAMYKVLLAKGQVTHVPNIDALLK